MPQLMPPILPDDFAFIDLVDCPEMLLLFIQKYRLIDGLQLASCDWKTVRLWRPDASGHWSQHALLPTPGRALAWAPDGRQLAIVNTDDSIEVWSTQGIKQAVLLDQGQQGRDGCRPEGEGFERGVHIDGGGGGGADARGWESASKLEREQSVRARSTLHGPRAR